MSEVQLNTIESLDRQPFKHLVATIGNLPTSFVDSMSYYECIAWLVKYLETKVIPAIDNNAEALEELQAYYIQLKEYVENYFENLDVQEEINNKLDDMAEQGQLTDIIAQYLQLAGVLAFNTVADMQAGENLVAGSTAKTLGKLNYLDGEGRFYKIRNITNDDVVDGVNIIQITADPTDTLIAELIPDDTISTVATLKETVEHLSDKKYIFIGDSYNEDYGEREAWYHSLVNYLGLSSSDYYQSGVGGAGWVHGSTFISQLQALSSTITNKSEITDIVVCGGINDMTESWTDINTAVNTFATYCATNYPNATVHIGMISWSKAAASRAWLNNALTYYNNFASIPNVKVIGNAHLPIHVYNLFLADGHPNPTGTHQISMYLANYLKGGICNVDWWRTVYAKASNTTIISTSTDTRILNIEQYMNNSNITVKLNLVGNYLELNGTQIKTDVNYKIADIEADAEQMFWFNDTLNNTLSEGVAYILDSNSTWTPLNYVISTYEKDVYIRFIGVNSGGTITVNNGSRLYIHKTIRQITYNANMC